MKENIRKIISITLIITGLFIVSTSIYKKIQTNKRQNALVEQFEKIGTKDTSGGKEQLDERFKDLKVIALIEIPSIKLSQPIVEGVEDELLQYYIGHFKETPQPGEKGNFALAGHSYSDYSEAFINLKKVKVGDEIIVKTKKEAFTYQIKESFIVTPSQVEVLNPTKEATITLITCTPGAKERLVLKGVLKESKKL